MESAHRSNPTNPVGNDDPSTTSNKLDSSLSFSSVSDSSDDPFAEDEPRKSTCAATPLHPYGPGSSIASYGQSSPVLPLSSSPSALSPHSPGMGSATQSPPVQMMDRSGDPAHYRIPSSVFSRTTTNPVEWSVASNESLFSIHTGNMSFTRDQIIMMGRSGELGIFKSGELVKPDELGKVDEVPKAKVDELPKAPVEPTTSSQFMNFSNNQHPVFKSTEDGKNSPNMGQGLGVSEAVTETMKEVLRENEQHLSEENLSTSKGVTSHQARMSHQSHHSDESRTSSKSFAFPILTGEGDRSCSVKVGLEAQQRNNSKAQSQSQPQTPSSKPAAKTNCFSCFSCCSFCS